MKILIINGPNLNLVGKREPEIYGDQSLDQYLENLEQSFKEVLPDLEITTFQSNHEGAIVDKIQEAGFSYNGIVLNGGAFTHYSYAIADAIAAITSPVVEVHISNIYAREAFRQKSVSARNCVGVITGLGLEGYALAIQYFVNNNL